MKDKSLDILLMVLFGLSGMTILTLAWVQPMAISERILTAVIGSIGLIVSLTKWLMLKSALAKGNTRQVLVEVGVEGKP
ncbi:hypothetical protein ACFLXG_05040 [Chloroflexota bacterium]